jgi:vitamin B12 transporter
VQIRRGPATVTGDLKAKATAAKGCGKALSPGGSGSQETCPPATAESLVVFAEQDEQSWEKRIPGHHCVFGYFSFRDRCMGPVTFFGGPVRLILLSLCLLTASATEIVPLEEVTITATRTPLPVRDTGTASYVLAGEELAAMHGRDLVDLLAQLPMLECTRTGSAGATANLRLRGSGDNHVLLLVDGVEQNDPSSPGRSVDLSHLDTGEIERIEVVLGPQSALYGADSIGGVVQVLTGHTATRRIEAGLSAGNHAQQQARLLLAERFGAVGLALSLGHQAASGESSASAWQGNSEADGYSREHGRLSLDWASPFGFRLEAALHGSRGESDLDNFGGPFGDDPNYTSDVTDLQGRLGISQIWFGGVSRISMWTKQLEREYHNAQDPMHPAESLEGYYDGDTRHVDLRHELKLGAHQLLAGLELERESAHSYSISESSWGPWEEVFAQKETETRSWLLQDHLRLGQLFVTAGLRGDHHDSFGKAHTGRLTLAWQPAENTVFRGSLGSGFKAPSLYQLHSVYGDSQLDPERSLGWDIGIDVLEDQLSFGLGAFDNRIRDMIDFNSMSWTYHNVAEARIRGLEISLERRDTKSVSWGLSAQLQEARDPSSGERLLRRASESAHGWVGLPVAGFSFRTDARWRGPREDLDFSSYPTSRIELGGVLLLDLRASRQLAAGLEGWLAVENLADRRWEDIWGYGAPGRWWRMGLDWSPLK